MEFKDYISNFMLAGLFLLCLVLFFVGIGAYHGNNNMVGDYYNTTKLNHTLTETANEAQTWKDSFVNDNPVIAVGGFIVFGFWAILTNIITSTITFISLIFDSLVLMLNIPPIVMGTLTALVIIGLIFAGWKVLKQG